MTLAVGQSKGDFEALVAGVEDYAIFLLNPEGNVISWNTGAQRMKEFAAFEGKTYAATTRRVYLSAAKKALKILGKTAETCGSYEELLDLVRESKAEKRFPKRLRIAPFVTFLDSKIPKEPEPLADYGPLRAWVLERIEKETNGTREATHFIRRDLAMLACLCLEPGRGSPRKWAKTALEVSRKSGNFEVQLWGKVVQTKELILPLLYWGTWYRSSSLSSGISQ